MGKPQFKSQEHIGNYYQSEIMDTIYTHVNGITDEAWNDIQVDVHYTLTEMIKDINRIKGEE